MSATSHVRIDASRAPEAGCCSYQLYCTGRQLAPRPTRARKRGGGSTARSMQFDNSTRLDDGRTARGDSRGKDKSKRAGGQGHTCVVLSVAVWPRPRGGRDRAGEETDGPREGRRTDGGRVAAGWREAGAARWLAAWAGVDQARPGRQGLEPFYWASRWPQRGASFWTLLVLPCPCLLCQGLLVVCCTVLYCTRRQQAHAPVGRAARGTCVRTYVQRTPGAALARAW